MGSMYVVFAGVILYLFLLQKIDTIRMSAARVALFFVAGYYALRSVVIGLEMKALGGAVFENIMNLEIALTALLQLAIAVGVFKKVQESGDEYLSYALWAAIGLVLIFFVAPSLAQGISSWF